MALISLLAFLFSTISPAVAFAADYGAWFPFPGERPGKGDVSAYQADVGAFNDGGVREMVSFACVLDDGTLLNEKEEEMLRFTFQYAGLVYTGDFEFNKIEGGLDDVDFSDIKDGNKDKLKEQAELTHNGGYEEGGKGMQMFLRHMAELIRKNSWTTKDHMDLVKMSSGKATHDWWHPGGKRELGVDIDEDETKPYRNSNKTRRDKIASLINTSAKNPLRLYSPAKKNSSGLPAGCDLGGYSPPPGGGFFDLVSNPGEAIAQAVFAIPAKFGGSLWNMAYAPAVKLSFWTPHSERGDTFFNITDSCAPGDKSVSASERAAQCKGKQPLGYDKRHINPKNQPGWLSIREFFQWLISGSYFILMFSAAIVFMFRGTASKTFNVMRMMPRLLISILFTLFSAFLIGAAVSTSNMLVQALFDPRDQGSMATMNAIVQQAWVAAGVGESVRAVLDAIVVLPMGLFAAGLVVAGALRQILLIMLVLLAPVAGFCLIIEAWRHWFTRWWSMLLVVVGLPVAMALVLKIALGLNPLLSHPDESYGTSLGLLGVFLAVITMFVLMTIARKTMGAALNSRLVGGSFAALGAGALGARLAGSSNPWARGAGALMRGYSRASESASGMAGKLVPEGKVLSSMHGEKAAKAGTGGGLVDRGLFGTTKLASKGGRAVGQLNDYMRRQQLGPGGGRELDPSELASFTELAKQHTGLDDEAWTRLSDQEKARHIQAVSGFNNVMATHDGRFIVDEGAEIRQARQASAAQAGAALARGQRPAPSLGGAPDPRPSARDAAARIRQAAPNSPSAPSSDGGGAANQQPSQAQAQAEYEAEMRAAEERVRQQGQAPAADPQAEASTREARRHRNRSEA